MSATITKNKITRINRVNVIANNTDIPDSSDDVRTFEQFINLSVNPLRAIAPFANYKEMELHQCTTDKNIIKITLWESKTHCTQIHFNSYTGKADAIVSYGESDFLPSANQLKNLKVD